MSFLLLLLASSLLLFQPTTAFVSRSLLIPSSCSPTQQLPLSKYNYKHSLNSLDRPTSIAYYTEKATTNDENDNEHYDNEDSIKHEHTQVIFKPSSKYVTDATSLLAFQNLLDFMPSPSPSDFTSSSDSIGGRNGNVRGSGGGIGSSGVTFPPIITTLDVRDMVEYVSHRKARIGRVSKIVKNGVWVVDSDIDDNRKDVKEGAEEAEEEKHEVIDLGSLTTVFKATSNPPPHLPTSTSKPTPTNTFTSNLYPRKPSTPSSLKIGSLERRLENLYQTDRRRVFHRDKSYESSIKAPPPSMNRLDEVNEIQKYAIKSKLLRNTYSQGYRRTSIDCAVALLGFPSDTGLTYRDYAGVAQILKDDADTGGRFERCAIRILGETSISLGNESEKSDEEQDEERQQEQPRLVVMNGGWLSVKKEIRKSKEATLFALKAKNYKNASDIHSSNFNNNTLPYDLIETKADELLLKRFEQLALLGDINWNDSNSTKDIDYTLKQTLKELNFTISPAGARDALIHLNIWSPHASSTTKGNLNYQKFIPWSKQILDSANLLSDFQRLKSLSLQHVKLNYPTLLTQRGVSDFTNVTCYLIDKNNTRFRDDAISVIPRRDGMKGYELLVHVIDTTSLFSTQADSFRYRYPHAASTLLNAARTRGKSQYIIHGSTLPGGPVHLLPPKALKGLSFGEPGTFNECITTWCCVDSKTGRINKCGVERSVIKVGVILSMEQADRALLLDEDSEYRDDGEKGLHSELGIIEGIVQKWSEFKRNNDNLSQRRDSSLTAREVISKVIQSDSIDTKKTTNGVFERTKANRLVDQSLALYTSIVSKKCAKHKAYIPRVGRVGIFRTGTAPLRRYIDLLAQRQIVEVCCGNVDGVIMSKDECNEAGREASALWSMGVPNPVQGDPGLRELQRGMKKAGNMSVIQAVGTGRLAVDIRVGKRGVSGRGLTNEVIISGLSHPVVTSVEFEGRQLTAGEVVDVRVTSLDVGRKILRIEAVAEVEKKNRKRKTM